MNYNFQNNNKFMDPRKRTPDFVQHVLSQWNLCYLHGQVVSSQEAPADLGAKAAVSVSDKRQIP